MKDIDVTAMGEVLIDFTSIGFSENRMEIFEQNPGGAPANLVSAVQNFGYQTAFIGKIGQDMQGHFLKKTLEKQGINLDNLIVDSAYYTTMAFVSIDEHKERHFSFARKNGADTQISKQEISTELIHRSRIFHVGSLSLTQEPARSATLYAMEAARKEGCLITYDPNYRASLWDDEDQAITQMRSVLDRVDIIKLSDEEMELLTGTQDIYKGADKLLEYGIQLVLVTRGGQGSIAVMKDAVVEVKACNTQAVDTTGAGDVFFGGFLSRYLGIVKENQRSCVQQLRVLSIEEIKECLRFGNSAAALCVRKRGGISAIPEFAEVQAVILENYL